MSRGKQFTREQQCNKTKAEKGLAQLMHADPTAKKIATRPWVFDSFRRLYDELCSECRQLVQNTKGRAQLNEYCPECQQKAKTILGSVPTIIGGKE